MNNPSGRPRAYDSGVEARDRALLERMRKGDLAALNDLMDIHLPRLTNAAEIITGSPDIAMDAVQEVFVQLWERRSELDIRDTVGGYLLVATRRRALDLVRQEQRHQRIAQELSRTYVAPELLNEGEDAVERQELQAIMQEVLRELPPRCREIFLLNREAGLSYTEIEAALGVSNATIRNQMSLANKHILKAMSDGAFERWIKD